MEENKKCFSKILPVALLMLVTLCLIVSSVSCWHFLKASNQILGYVKEIKVDLNLAELAVDFGDGQRKSFRGYADFSGASLIDVLASLEGGGKIAVEWEEDPQGAVLLKSIDGRENGLGGNWEISFPALGWKRNLSGSDIDLRKIILSGGLQAELIYR